MVWTLSSRSVCPHSLTYFLLLFLHHGFGDLHLVVWAANQFHTYFAVQVVPGLSLEAVLDLFEHLISVCSCVYVHVVYTRLCVHVYTHVYA